MTTTLEPPTLEKAEKVSFKVCFRKKRSNFAQVDADAGMIENVSLIQLGVAVGHEMQIDQRSLETALVALGDNLPAFITHEGALDSDRILEQIGAFSDFYLDGGKLRGTFRAFDSFRVDESNRYNRLFDIASEMPDAFGVSMVFEADLVWPDPDGREWSIDEKPVGVRQQFPSVRFLNVSSADFVESPAANEGLFSISSTNTKSNLIMSEEQTKTDETEVEALAEISEPVEELDQAESEESETANNALAELVDNLTMKLAELQSEVADLKGALSESENKSKTLEQAFEGVDALDESTEEPAPALSIVETFNNADPREQRRLWKESKSQLLQI
jgi:hypothetical protein